MLVVDSEKSERGPQRRKDAAGRLLHCCCVCRTLAPWGPGWSIYCSDKDLDDCAAVPKFCSDACRAIGGPKARNATAEMKQAAKDAEWREPVIAWRPATEREKYDAAAYSQHQNASKTHAQNNE